MALEAVTAPCTLPGAEGSQPPGKKRGWWVGPRRRDLPAPVPHPAPPFQQARRPGIPWGPTAHGVCELGRLLLLSRPPHCVKQEVAQKSQVSPASAQLPQH